MRARRARARSGRRPRPRRAGSIAPIASWSTWSISVKNASSSTDSPRAAAGSAGRPTRPTGATSRPRTAACPPGAPAGSAPRSRPRAARARPCPAAPGRARTPRRPPRPPPRCRGATPARPRRAGARSTRPRGSARRSSARREGTGADACHAPTEPRPPGPVRLDSTPAARPSAWFADARRNPVPLGGRLAAFAVLALPGRGRAQERRMLAGAPLNIFADGLGAVQVRADGVSGGLFYDPDETPGHAGLEIKEGANFYPLQDGFSTAPGRVERRADHVLRRRRRHQDDALGLQRRTGSAGQRGRHLHRRHASSSTSTTGSRTSPGAPVCCARGALADLYVGNHDTGNGVISDLAPRFVGGRTRRATSSTACRRSPPGAPTRRATSRPCSTTSRAPGSTTRSTRGAPTTASASTSRSTTSRPGETREIDVRWLMASGRAARHVTRRRAISRPYAVPTPEQLCRRRWPARPSTSASARGKILIKIPPSKKFVELTDPMQIPVGAIVDARKGKLNLVSAADKNGKTQTAYFYGGIFKIGQDQADPSRSRASRWSRRWRSARRRARRGGGQEAEDAPAVGERQGQLPYDAATTARRRSGGRRGSSPIAAARRRPR